MATSQTSLVGPANGLQPLLTPAFLAPRSPVSDYTPLTVFAATEQVQTQYVQTPALAFNPKLPSLEGLLKQMQTASLTLSVASSPQRHSRLSPISRDLASMPSLPAVISPTMTKRVLPMTLMPPTSLPDVASFASQTYRQMSSSIGPSFSSKKRSWTDATFVPHVAQSAKSRASPSSHSSHRSRASKFCRIEGCERISQRNNLCHSHGGKRLCKEEGCASKDRGNGFCIKHGGGKICSMIGCEKKARRKGLCTQHFRVSSEHNMESIGSSYLYLHDRA